MKATIHLEGNNATELAKGLRAHLAIYEAAGNGTDTGTTKTGATKGTKKAAPTEEGEDEEFDYTSPEDTDADATEEDEADEATDVTEEDVIEACRKHSKKNTREATLALLWKKFKVKSVGNLKPEQYATVVATLQGKR